MNKIPKYYPKDDNPPQDIINFIQFMLIRLTLITPSIDQIFIDKYFIKLQFGTIIDYSSKIHKLIDDILNYKKYIKKFTNFNILKKDLYIIRTFPSIYNILLNNFEDLDKKLNKSTPQEKIEINNIIVGLKEIIDILIPIANNVIKVYNDENNDKLDYLEIKY
jgi:hypothetical protein